MTHYLGTYGFLVPMPPHTVVDPEKIKHSRAINEKTTMGGNRVAYVGRRTHREWSLDIPPCTASEFAPVLAFLEGEYGFGPWWWIDEWAQRTNILPPLITSLRAPWGQTVAGPPVMLPDGTAAGRTLISDIASGSWQGITDQTRTRLDVPVLPGSPLTASMWMNTSGQALRIRVLAEDGTVLVTSPVGRNTTGTWELVSTTLAQVPADGYSAYVQITGSGRIARPSLTWTDAPPLAGGSAAGGYGAGCQYAVLDGDVDQNIDLLLPDDCPVNDARRWRESTSGSYSVREVN